MVKPRLLRQHIKHLGWAITRTKLCNCRRIFWQAIERAAVTYRNMREYSHSFPLWNSAMVAVATTPNEHNTKATRKATNLTARMRSKANAIGSAGRSYGEFRNSSTRRGVLNSATRRSINLRGVLYACANAPEWMALRAVEHPECNECGSHRWHGSQNIGGVPSSYRLHCRWIFFIRCMYTVVSSSLKKLR